MRLSIIIVNYNVTSLLRKCLQSIERYVTDVAYEVIVIDNLSPDTSWRELIKEFPKVKFIENKANEGFSKANNKAIQQAQGEYILLLNPDTELESEQMNEILNFADSQSNFGCLGVQMHDANGEFLPESKRSVPDMGNSFEKLFFGLKKNHSRSYYRNDIPNDGIAEVDIMTGAFLLIPLKVYREVGGLDEKYFMYGEDIDLCYSIKNNGYKNFYYGKMKILHHKGESTIKNEIYLQRFYGAMDIFISKYYANQPLKKKILKLGLKTKHFLEKSKLR